MPVSIEQFRERLTRSGLLSAEEVAALEDGLAPDKRPQNAQDLARELIRSERLTKFQAEAVYRGRTKGLVMGEYVILDRIGAGGMGEVLKARHRRMKRVVALKVLPAKAMKSPDAVRRFYREVEAAARLEHPNIVTAHDASECDGIHYLVMQFVDGEDLAQIVKRRGPMSVEASIECMVQAARGLQYAHDHGVIHRDIKPGNILLDREGTVKILDMGLARLEEEVAGADEGAERLTSSGQIMGTVDYIAPEQAEDTHAADHRADIYSLGCTLCRLLTAKPPYSGETPIQVVMAHIQKPIPSIRESRADVPEEVDAVYQKMLAKRPEDRYQSMNEVIEALEACREPDKPADKLAAEAPSDSALSSFLDRLGQGGSTGTKQQQATKAEETLSFAPAPEQETGSRLKEARLGGALARPKLAPEARRKVVRYVGIGGGAALCIVLLGLLFVVLRGDQTPPLPPGEGRGEGSSKQAQPPLPAVAPFSAHKATWHQKQWADYLGLPVEWTNFLGMKFVLIPPGEFMMGSPEAERQAALEGARAANDKYAIERIPTEGPRHRVKITRPFYLGKCEVTQAQWQAVMGGNPSKFKNPTNPVEQASWDDIQPFLAKLNVAVGWAKRSAGPPHSGTRDGGPALRLAHPTRAAAAMKYALPTEAQWEYACRAGTTTAFCFGDNAAMLGEYGWFKLNSSGKTHPVGQKRPNAWGLHDMYGNVSEWCVDWRGTDYYAQSPLTDPNGPLTGSGRVRRGGGWYDHAVPCRSAHRDRGSPDDRLSGLGFRLVCEIPTDPAKLKKFATTVKAPKSDEFEARPQIVEEPQEYKPITIGPPAKPVPIEIKPEPIAVKPGEPLSPMALVTDPAPIPGLLSWSIVAIDPRYCIRSAMFSPNNQKLATISGDTIRIWDAEKRRFLQAIVGHDKPVLYCIWSPDGRFLASSSFDKSVRLWDASSGRLVRTLRCPDFVPRLAWSPDGSVLAAANNTSGKVYFWDLRDGTDHGTIDSHGPALAVAWSPDATMLATHGENRSAALWNPRTNTLIRSLENQGGSGLSWSPDGKLIASWGRHNETRPVRLWDVAAGQQRGELPPRGAITHCVAWSPHCVAWSPDSKTLAVGENGSFSDGKPASVVLWREETGQPVWEHVLADYYNRVNSLSFFPDGKMLAMALDNGLTIACDTQSGKTEFTLPANPFDVWETTPSPDGMSWMTTCPETGLAECWEIGRDAVPHLRRQLNEAGEPVALSLAARLCATHDPVSGSTRVWDLTQDSQPVELATDKGVQWAAFAPDGTKLATANKKGKGQLWDIKSASLLHELPGAGNGLAWSPDGKLLAVGAGSDVLLSNPENPRETTSLSGAGAALQRLTWSPDGKVLAAAAENGCMYLWDCDSGKLLHELYGGDTGCPVLSWLGKGEHLVSTGRSSRPKSCVWDVASGKRLRTIDGRCYICGDMELEDDVSGFRVRRVNGDLLCTVLVLCKGQYLSVSPDGHYRGPAGVEKEFVYVVLTEQGEQLTLTPEEFSKKYGWKNDPSKAEGGK